ncbi:hypothetical protein LINPERPRIM_LOCUS20491 [Linum perenne]
MPPVSTVIFERDSGSRMRTPTSQLGLCRSVWSCLRQMITNCSMFGRKEWQEHLPNL